MRSKCTTCQKLKEITTNILKIIKNSRKIFTIFQGQVYKHAQTEMNIYSTPFPLSLKCTLSCL